MEPDNTRTEKVSVARVNGKPIRQSDLYDVLLPGYGRRVLDEMVRLEVVRQEAARREIGLTDEMGRAELDRFLEELSPGKSRREQSALLEYMLSSRNLSRGEFDLIIQREALLREMVDKQVTVTEAMLAQEFEEQYGRKVLVRQLVVGSFRDILNIQERLKAGADFTELVKEYSQDQMSLAQEGLRGPFSQGDNTIPPEVRRQAFELKQPGQYSKEFRYHDDNLEWWCIVRLEQDFPRKMTSPDDVQEELRHIIQNRTIKERMLELQGQLEREARIMILEPRLIR
ncbi:MAG: peptidylprolyl isomerase [Sedimentisphaerales bacterium]|nr:peptidylprolyl isomerase [Sedimentisphaerales bacterium]